MNLVNTHFLKIPNNIIMLYVSNLIIHSNFFNTKIKIICCAVVKLSKTFNCIYYKTIYVLKVKKNNFQ